MEESWMNQWRSTGGMEESWRGAGRINEGVLERWRRAGGELEESWMNQ